jgi:NhaA family Na+:H+ antiporter
MKHRVSLRLPFIRAKEQLLRPFQKFVELDSSSGLILLGCTVVALFLANSPWREGYFALLETPVAVRFGSWQLEMPLLEWINEGLMSVFFFVVGLEIKREFLVGELNSFRKAALPVAGAIGGVVVPGAIYLSLNWGLDSARGWGVPIATDIAFAIGVLTLLGSRVPVGLKVFLTALAIVDDIVAVLVIALFYAGKIHLLSLLYAGLALGGMALANLFGVRNVFVYAVFGGLLWLFLHHAGLHATLAGVLGAMMIPASNRLSPEAFQGVAQDLMIRFRESHEEPLDLLSERQRVVVEAMERHCEDVQTPLQRLEHYYHMWSAFFVVPIFGLANAGVTLEPEVLHLLSGRVGLGILLGLFLGKQIGITLASWAAVRLRLAELPEGVSFYHVYGAACVAGIGFTMSLFIAHLAFGSGDLMSAAKVAILTASLLSACLGALILSRLKPAAKSEY